MTSTTDSSGASPDQPGQNPVAAAVSAPAAVAAGRLQRWWQVAYARGVRVYQWVARRPEWMLVSAFLAILLLVALRTYTRTLGGQLWMDEAITVGIAGHPLHAIPGIMKMDGSPPLFYMLLHVWISIFGNSEAQTHALSVLIALIAIPTSYFGSRTLLDKRTAAFVAILFTVNAFMISYSTETRMYALMVLLGLCASIGYVAGFLHRRKRFLPLYVVAQTLMIYTHSWGLFFGAASFITLALVWRLLDHQQRQGFIRDALISFAAVAILYLPWLPTFLYQAAHTAAPWDAKPRLGLPLQIARSIMGGTSLGVVSFVVAIIGFWTLLGKAKRQTREAQVLFVLLAVVALTFAMAWISSQITPAWVPRYFAPTVGPVLIIVGIGLSRARTLGVVVLLFACTTVLHPLSYSPTYKSDIRQISGELGWQLQRDDLVIVGQPEQTPLAYYYLPAGLRFANTQAGLERDPTFFNWENALPKYRAANPAAMLDPLLASLKVGQRLLYIQPLTEGNAQWKQSWTEMIRIRSAQWGQIIADDPQLKEIGWAPQVYNSACCVADSAVLYQKVQ